MPTEVSQPARKPSYFLISVSTRENLELCVRYSLAGFPSGESGAWTFCEIAEGDLISFLYGAKAHNLYRVTKREAVRDAQHIGPWPPLTFRETGRTYYFPFRLGLEPIRAFSESLVRAEFAYVAENLLLRGGYSKTHFQADQTTLQSASQLGELMDGQSTAPAFGEYITFEPRFARVKGLANAPEITRFRETILQSVIKRYLASEFNLRNLLTDIGFNAIPAAELEVLGEKAIPQGHIDILLKRRVPMGTDSKIPVEVKTKKALPKDLSQLLAYMNELRGECPIGMLIANDFHKQVIQNARNFNVRLIRYSLAKEAGEAPTFEELHRSLKLESISA